MICVGINGVGMAVIVGMGLGYKFEWPILAKPCAVSARVAVIAFLSAHAFHMVVVAFLHGTHLGLKAQN